MPVIPDIESNENVVEIDGKRGKEELPPNIRPVKISRDIDIKAQEAKDRAVFPKPPGRVINFDQFMEWQALLTPEMISNEDIYIYRHKPFIITDPKYIESLKSNDCTKISLEHMTKTHGGGDYGFDVYNRSDGTDKRIFQVKLSIPITEVEPILDYTTLDLHHPKNVAYVTGLKNRGILNKDGLPMNSIATGTSVEGMQGVISTILGFVDKLNTSQQKSLVDQLKQIIPQTPVDPSGGVKDFIPIFLKKMEQENPGNQMQGMMTMFTSLLATVKEMNPKSEPSKDNSNDLKEMFGQMLRMQQDHSKVVTDLMTQMINQKQTSSDPLEMVEKVLGIQERLSNLGSGGKQVPQDKWDRIIDLGERVLPVVFETVGGIIQQRMSGASLGSGVGIAGSQPSKPKVTRDSANPFNNPQTARALPEPSYDNNKPIPEQPQARPNPSPLDNIPQQNISDEAMQQVAQVIINFGGYIIQSLNSGQPGYEFAATISELPGVGIAPMQLVRNYGITETLELSKKIQDNNTKEAIFYNQVKGLGDQYILKWLSDFVNFQEILEKLEEEEELETQEEIENGNKEKKEVKN